MKKQKSEKKEEKVPVEEKKKINDHRMNEEVK
jgi:hypothetical protein